ncbi:MAG: hypothetical protein NZL83_01290 [Candidatus Absconditabacterales bacterium]|nr:hypothetical protein [Candidatus Absconditabacterales bacterium]
MRFILYGLGFVTLVFVLLRFTPLYENISGSPLADAINTIDRSITHTLDALQTQTYSGSTSIQTGNINTGAISPQTGAQEKPSQPTQPARPGPLPRTQTVQQSETSSRQDRGGVSRAGDQARAVCTLPWSSETIPDGSQIIAYKNRVADDSNVCEGEIRICRNGQLGGGFTFQQCTYTIDGLNDGREIIAGASSTRHNLFLYTKDEHVDPTYRLGIRREEDDHTLYDERGRIIERFDPRGRTRDPRIFLTGSLRYSPDHASIQSGKQTQPCQFIESNGLVHLIPHGEYILTYKNNMITSHETCEFEQRICVNGDLRGSFKHTSCTILPDITIVGSGTITPPRYLRLLSTNHYRNSIAQEHIQTFQPPREMLFPGSGSNGRTGNNTDGGRCPMKPLAFVGGDRSKTCTSSQCSSYRVRGSLALKQRVTFLVSYTVDIELPSGTIETRKGTLLPGMKTIDLTVVTDLLDSQRELYRIRVSFRTNTPCFLRGGRQGYRESGYSTLPCRRQLVLDDKQTRIEDVCCGLGETINYGETLPSSSIIDAGAPIMCGS